MKAWRGVVAPLAEGLAAGRGPAAVLASIAAALPPRSPGRALAERLGRDVQAGRPLADALRLRGAPAPVVEAIRAGEEAGRLPAAGRALAGLSAHADALRHDVPAAVALPAITLFFTFSAAAAMTRTLGELAGAERLAQVQWIALAGFALLVGGALLAVLRAGRWLTGGRAAAVAARPWPCSSRPGCCSRRPCGRPACRGPPAPWTGRRGREALARDRRGRALVPWVAGARGLALPVALAGAAADLEADADGRRALALAWIGGLATLGAALLVAWLMVLAYLGLGDAARLVGGA
ncbi:MAG: type II secretion system F family protein [Myxococcales bacterium]|nr:type II secretion system F family protein [Myxococcales bacterium]